MRFSCEYTNTRLPDSSQAPETLDTSSLTDQQRSAYKIVKHLITTHCSELGMLLGISDKAASQRLVTLRKKGFIRVVGSVKVASHPKMVYSVVAL